jgi:hypothetical protein
MNKTIIALYGRAKEGKTETIKKVCELIMTNFPNAVSYPHHINYNADILAAIQLGNVKIGLESQGDPKSRMIREDTIKQLADKNIDFQLGGCDIIVCATRTGGATIRKVDTIADRYGYNTLWKSSYYTPGLNTAVVNKIAAEEIVNLIQAIIVGQL